MTVVRDGLRFAAFALAVTFVGSGCSSTRSQTAVDAGPVLAACGWSPSLDRIDGSVVQCVAARTFLACSGSDGGGELCLSDDATQCPGLSGVVGESFGNCLDLCHPNEYAVACGGPGPGPWPSPPAECRGIPPGPGGGSVACCPCGADAHPLDDAADVFDCGGTADAKYRGP